MFDLITRLITGGGLWGVFLLMLVENLVPVIPSEIIMPMAGFEAALDTAGHTRLVRLYLERSGFEGVEARLLRDGSDGDLLVVVTGRA